ncbi:MAG TPA: hydrogenase maturation protease [Vicinamibacterales bacterium]|nr:hydrogenase maturation protease [Vicinamibacterales bacterium]
MRCYILGLGNVLMGDDGFGPAVARAFDAAYDLDGDAEVVDLGTPGLDLMPWFFDAEQLVIVDTVKSDAAPGTLRVYNKADILKHLPSVRVGPHDPGVKEALLTLEFAGRGPSEVVLVGVVPGSVGMSTELSAPVAKAVSGAVALLVDALTHLGHTVRRRSAPEGARPWWSAR